MTSNITYVCQKFYFALKGLYLDANALALNITVKMFLLLLLFVYFSCLTRNDVYVSCKKIERVLKVLFRIKEIWPCIPFNKQT